MKKILFVSLISISGFIVNPLFASENSTLLTQVEKTCWEYQTKLEDYLDATLPVYLDENLTKWNQININNYKSTLKKSSDKQVEIVIWKEKVKVPYATAELLNLGNKFLIIDTIYNPLWINASAFPYKLTTENVKDYAFESDDMILFCKDLSLFVEDGSLDQQDIDTANKTLKENLKLMNSSMRKFNLEISKIKNRKVPLIVLKNNNFSLWKLQIIIDYLEMKNAKG